MVLSNLNEELNVMTEERLWQSGILRQVMRNKEQNNADNNKGFFGRLKDVVDTMRNKGNAEEDISLIEVNKIFEDEVTRRREGQKTQSDYLWEAMSRKAVRENGLQVSDSPPDLNQYRKVAQEAFLPKVEESKVDKIQELEKKNSAIAESAMGKKLNFNPEQKAFILKKIEAYKEREKEARLKGNGRFGGRC